MKVPLKDTAGRININQSQLLLRRDRKKQKKKSISSNIVCSFVAPFASIQVFVENNTAGEKTDEFQNMHTKKEKIVEGNLVFFLLLICFSRLTKSSLLLSMKLNVIRSPPMKHMKRRTLAIGIL